MSAPTWDFCKQQVRRLEGLPGFKFDQHLLKELIGALQEIAFSNDHVERMIDWWMRNEQFAPKIADLYDIADLVPPVERFPPGCAHCSESDWVVEERDQRRYVRRCDCLRGRVFTELSAYDWNLKTSPARRLRRTTCWS